MNTPVLSSDAKRGMITVSKAAEARLVEVLNALPNPMGWKAVHFHLSRLLEQYKSDYQVKIAVNLIHDLLKNHDGYVFVYVDNSLVVLCQGMDRALLNKLMFQLRYLYMDDPLAYTEDGKENAAFCTSYELDRESDEFFRLATLYMTMAAKKEKGPVPDATRRVQSEMITAATSRVTDIEKTSPKKDKAEEFSASRLVMVERDLNYADLSKVIRRQPICAVQANGAVRRVFDELYINISHLRQMLRAEVDFLSNKWLFKYLTQLLDQRVLALLRQHSSRFLDVPVSLNVNIETLLSDDFAEFDAGLPAALKVSVVFEIHVADVFADMRAFLYAKNAVQKLGYRVCLDGLTTLSFPQIDRGKLGFDLVKLQWNADVESDLASAENSSLLAAIRHCGNNRVILCRCDGQSAIEYGQALGVSLFQGRRLDTLLNPASRVEN